MKLILRALVFLAPWMVLAIGGSNLMAQQPTAPTASGVINVAQLAGTDIGAKISAYVASKGPRGTIFIPEGSYTFSMPIDIVLNGPSTINIDCASRGTILNYTGSGAAIRITYRSSSLIAMSMENCSLDGSHAASETDGILLKDTGGLNLYNVAVSNFPGDSLCGIGAIGTNFYGVSLSNAGGWNLRWAPDPVTGRSSNANHMFGGALVYGKAGNYWDAGTAAHDDQNNTLSGVTEEESWYIPQNIVEHTDNDVIQDGYEEYINMRGKQTSDLYGTIVGNYAGSGFGTNTTTMAHGFVFQDETTGTAVAARGYTSSALYLVNSVFATIRNVDDFGGPTYGISFYPEGKNLSTMTYNLGIAWLKGEYENPPASGMLYQTMGQPVATGQYQFSVDGPVFGELNASEYKVHGRPLSSANLSDGSSLTHFVGSLTTTANESDILMSGLVRVGAACQVEPQNDVAAGLAGVYVPLVANAGNVVVHHPATAGAVFSVFCQ